MLFRLASILLLAGIRVVAAAGEPPAFARSETLVSRGDLDAELQPYIGSPLRGGDGNPASSKLIRGLLVTRQYCQSGWGLCNDRA